MHAPLRSLSVEEGSIPVARAGIHDLIDDDIGLAMGRLIGRITCAVGRADEAGAA